MRLLCFILALALALVDARADAETLRLAASVDNEELAEETVSLLHCLSERKEVPWEFTGEASGSHWLKVREKANNKLSGTYHSGKEEAAFEMKSGEAEAVCERLAPETEKIGLAPPLAAEAAFPEILVSEK